MSPEDEQLDERVQALVRGGCRHSDLIYQYGVWLYDQNADRRVVARVRIVQLCAELEALS